MKKLLSIVSLFCLIGCVEKQNTPSQRQGAVIQQDEDTTSYEEISNRNLQTARTNLRHNNVSRRR